MYTYRLMLVKNGEPFVASISFSDLYNDQGKVMYQLLEAILPSLVHRLENKWCGMADHSNVPGVAAYLEARDKTNST